MALCFQIYNLVATNKDKYVNSGPKHQVLKYALVKHQPIRIW